MIRTRSSQLSPPNNVGWDGTSTLLCLYVVCDDTWYIMHEACEGGTTAQHFMHCLGQMVIRDADLTYMKTLGSALLIPR
jgi:hypothetical protein